MSHQFLPSLRCFDIIPALKVILPAFLMHYSTPMRKKFLGSCKTSFVLDESALLYKESPYSEVNMRYQALYRAWRPETFFANRRQDAVVRTLRHQVETGRVAHAYLFCGTRGTGKTTAAKVLSRAINCLHPWTATPCGECDVCCNSKRKTAWT